MPTPEKSEKAGNPPTTFILRLEGQMDRSEMIAEGLATLLAEGKDYGTGELDAQVSIVDALHSEFVEEHRSLETTFSRYLADSDYRRDKVSRKTYQVYAEFKQAAGKRRQALAPAPSSREETRSPIGASSQGHLPDIPLPTFQGDSAQWASFSNLFTSLILKNNRLSNTSRLHYLQGCLDGAPAQLIASFPLEDSSLEPAWQLLVDSYDHPRLRIQTHLTAMFNVTPPNSASAADLHKLITTVSGAINAIRSMGADAGECALTHLVIRHLDPSLLQEFDSSPHSTREYPTFQQVKDFLADRVQLLRVIDANGSAPDTRPQPRSTAAAHHVGTHQQLSLMAGENVGESDAASSCSEPEIDDPPSPLE